MKSYHYNYKSNTYSPSTVPFAALARTDSLTVHTHSLQSQRMHTLSYPCITTHKLYMKNPNLPHSYLPIPKLNTKHNSHL